MYLGRRKSPNNSWKTFISTTGCALWSGGLTGPLCFEIAVGEAATIFCRATWKVGSIKTIHN